MLKGFKNILLALVGVAVGSTSSVAVGDSIDQPYLSNIQNAITPATAPGGTLLGNSNSIVTAIGTPDPLGITSNPIIPTLSQIAAKIGVGDANANTNLDQDLITINQTLQTLATFFQGQTSDNTNNANFGNQMQNLKDFLAMTFLRYRTWQIDSQTMPPPSFSDNLWVARKVADADNLISSTQSYLDDLYAGWNLYATADTTSPAAMIARHTTMFCGMRDQQNSICDWQPTLVNANGLLTMRDPMPGDYLASSLFGSNTLSDNTSVFIAREFIRNLTAASPPPLLPPGQMFSNYTAGADPSTFAWTQTGITNFTSKLQFQAYSTMAQEPLFAMLAERIGFPSASAMTASLPNGMPVEIYGQSMLDTMKYEATHRYNSPDWHIAMNKMSLEGVMREIAGMMAFQNYLLFQNYLNTERMLAIEAANMGVFANTIAQTEIARQSAASASPPT